MVETIAECVDNIVSLTQSFEVLMTMSSKDCCVLECIAMSSGRELTIVSEEHLFLGL